MPKSSLTIGDIVDAAIKEAPSIEKVASAPIVENKYFSISNNLDKLAAEIESEEKATVVDYKESQSEKVAQINDIVKTYLELV
jgi:hypothetical protein